MMETEEYTIQFGSQNLTPELMRMFLELGNLTQLPEDALKQATADKRTYIPAFLELIEHYNCGQETSGLQQDAIFLVVHLLAQWQVREAFLPLLTLLAIDQDQDDVLGIAVTETMHKVLVATYDGNYHALFAFVRNQDADVYARSSVLEAITILTFDGLLAREKVQEFLLSLYEERSSNRSEFVWSSWAVAIGHLGLESLKPRVEEAFQSGLIDPVEMDWNYFESDLVLGMQGSEVCRMKVLGRYDAFEGVIEEFSRWPSYNARHDFADTGNETWSLNPSPKPVINPNRHVGRNAPCPCGSGKKFKKCCLKKESVTG